MPTMTQEVDVKNGVWVTPRDFFEKLHVEFAFTVDVAASHDNAMLPRYFTEEIDGLAQDWSRERVWCNPPYGREIHRWVEKLASKQALLCVALLPARTDTRWFHEHIYGKAEIRFLRGRLKFSGMKGSGKFPSMICIWRADA